MKILIEYHNEDGLLYKAEAISFERAEQELETLRKVVEKDALAEKDNDF